MLCNPRMQTRVLESRADLNLDQLMSPSAIETVRTAGTHTHAYAFSPMQSITCTCTRCIHSGVHGVCMYAMCVLQARTAHASVKILNVNGHLPTWRQSLTGQRRKSFKDKVRPD